MKSDIDRLMQERGFDALFVMGEATGNHVLHYMTNHAKVTHGMVLKKRGEEAVLIVGGMERDEAAKSGLTVRTTAEFNLYKHIKEADTPFEGNLRMLKEIFETYEVSGTVAFYGVSDPGQAYVKLSQLDEMLPAISVTGETDTSIFDDAYTTKDADEIAAIKNVARRTNLVMDDAVSFIQRHRVQDDQLVDEEGQPLTVGDVKQYVRQRLLAQDLEDSEGMIFAVDRDGGVPHSRGEESDVLAPGQCIVFDLFPRGRDNGYFHDMTRTFCLGHASEKVQRAYDHVMQAFNAVMDDLRVGETGSHYQDLTCDIFEEHGHKTSRSDPGTEVGYVHSLGHGLGLQIHSRPRLSNYAEDTIEAGQVFTVEPGLYYPDDGYGVRIEDTVYVDQDGVFHSLTPYPKDLIIPLD